MMSEALQARSTIIYQRLRRCWEDLSEILLRQLSFAADDGSARADSGDQVPTRPRCAKRIYRRYAPVLSSAYRDILESQPEHEGGARVRSRAGLEQEELSARGLRRFSSRFTRELERVEPTSIDVHEIQLSREDDPLATRSVTCSCASVSFVGRAHRSMTDQRAFDAYSRCFKVDPTNETGSSRARAASRAIQDRWEDLSDPLRGARLSEALDAPLQHELLFKLASDHGRASRADSERAIEFYRQRSGARTRSTPRPR
jgi:hypothetical protein